MGFKWFRKVSSLLEPLQFSMYMLLSFPCFVSLFPFPCCLNCVMFTLITFYLYHITFGFTLLRLLSYLVTFDSVRYSTRYIDCPDTSTNCYVCFVAGKTKCVSVLYVLGSYGRSLVHGFTKAFRNTSNRQREKTTARRRSICNTIGRHSAIQGHGAAQGRRLGRLEGELAGRSEVLPGGHVLSVPGVSAGIVSGYYF